MKNIYKIISILLICISFVGFSIVLIWPYRFYIFDTENVGKGILIFFFLGLTLLISQWIYKFVMKLIICLYSNFRNKLPTKIIFFKTHFLYRDSKYSRDLFFKEYKWNNIEKIYLFKRDLIGVDQIGISMLFCSKVEVFITEDTDSWKEFLKEVDKNFPQIKVWEEILYISYPPFEEKGKIIYDKMMV
jgi:hypothetical protein